MMGLGFFFLGVGGVVFFFFFLCSIFAPKPKMVTNNFGNQKYMHAMGRLIMHLRCALCFPFGLGVGGILFVKIRDQCLPLTLAQAKYGDKQFWKSKFHPTNECYFWKKPWVVF